MSIISMTFSQPVLSYIDTDSFTFSPNGRLAKVQEWAWRFLHKCKALVRYRDCVTDYRKIVFDNQVAIDRILDACDQLQCLHRDPKVLLIGAADFAELMRNDDIRGAGPFSFGGVTTKACFNGGWTTVGLKVRVVPWMRGFLVLDEAFADLGNGKGGGWL